MRPRRDLLAVTPSTRPALGLGPAVVSRSRSTGLAPVAIRPARYRPVGVHRRARRIWWRSVADAGLRFLFFVLGPADIGPLGPPGLMPAMHLAAAGGRIERPGISQPGSADRHIAVIPVP
jgi:hypothetical protein